MAGRSSKGWLGGLSGLSGVLTALEDAAPLDKLVTPVKAAVQKVLVNRRVADTLHGVPLGHPLHPLLAQGALGTLASATILDLLPIPRVSSRVLTLAGIGIAVPAIAAGYADWSQLHPQQQRVGLVHSAANAVSVGLYAGALLIPGLRGRLLSVAGFSAAGFGGFLGAHMSYRQASGANHTEGVPHLVQPGWHDLCAVDDLPAEGGAVQQVLDGTMPVPLLVARSGGEVRVLAAECSHMSGPLFEGEIADGCVTCPWHRSVFDLSDGSVVHGPATSPQPSFRTRVEAGRLQVLLEGAG